MSYLIFGHRGIPSLATENSLSGFKKILENSVKAVELDVHLTLDNQLVVIHDFNTERLSGIDCVVSDTEYSRIKELTIGADDKIPLLSEVFDLLGSRVFYDIEVKSLGKNRKELTGKLLDLIKKYKLDSCCIVSSFDPLLIKEFNRLKSGIKTGVIYSRHKDVPFFLREGLGVFFTHVDIIKPHYKQLKGPLFFLFTKILKKECYTWTVNDKETFEYVINRGCSGICSNNPQDFI